MTEVIDGAAPAPVKGPLREGIWVMGNGLASVGVGESGAELVVDLFSCQYGGVTPECDADLMEAATLIRELGFTRTGEVKEENGVILLELL